MVALRSLARRARLVKVEASRAAKADAVASLAQRWAALATHGTPSLTARLATLLHRLASILEAEPFWALAGREIGMELVASELCDDPDCSQRCIEDFVPASLRLLRQEAPAALGLSGPDTRQRLADALDEVVGGLAAALRERVRREHEDRLRTNVRFRQGIERALAEGDTHYRTLYTQGPVGIGIIGLDGMVLDVNPALQRMFGLPGPLEQPRPASDFIHPEDAPGAVDRFRRLVQGEPDVMRMQMRFIRCDGMVLLTQVVVSLVRDDAGQPTHCIAVVEDHSERYRLQDRLMRASFQDQLTQLPNRFLTEQWVRRAFGPGGARRVGICALDVDGFAPVNDGLGRQAADQLLLAVSARLQMVVGEHLVTRTGGDEFAVLVANPDGIDEMCRLADRVLAALATPFSIDGHSITVTASIGVAEASTAEVSPEELMRAADVALSWAKAGGGGQRVVFDPERAAGESARFALLAGLRTGIERGEFRVEYQPIVRLSDGRVRGAEALVRWEHPKQGRIPPGLFIELAERSGAIVPLGRWVLETACAEAASWWRELGTSSPFVSVNVSPVQLVAPGWVDDVRRILDETGLPPARLQLEITEQAVLRDEAAALDALTQLDEVGVHLALDDFGTGYSSLAWLRQLPVHSLKIDGSFISGLRHPSADPVDRSIVRAMVGMAHALGLEVTAEWVETELQATRLAVLDCDLAQGTWFGPAGSGAWVRELVRRSIT